jgi:Zn finger protein HypA/HybF involved in hydrogenase expression
VTRRSPGRKPISNAGWANNFASYTYRSSYPCRHAGTAAAYSWLMPHDDEYFGKAVRENVSVAGVLRTLGLRPAGANYSMVHRRVRELSLSTSHWTGMGHLRGRSHDWAKKLPLSVVLCSPTRYRGGSAALKERLFREGILTRRCSHCGLESWCNAPLALHLDHVNGDSEDNRVENLRVLCPNCHSQTATYCGRNKGRRKRSKSPQRCADVVSVTKCVNELQNLRR